jgi:hypothetical protein
MIFLEKKPLLIFPPLFNWQKVVTKRKINLVINITSFSQHHIFLVTLVID